MRNKFFMIFLSLPLILLYGCSSSITSITQETESLQGEPFTINYPIDWRFKGIMDQTADKHMRSAYRFSHPKNRNCNVTIEMFQSPDTANLGQQDLNQILATKIRTLRKTFTKEGYKNFTADTVSLKFGGTAAEKMMVKAAKGENEREVILYMMERNGIIYFVTYQWFSQWSDSAKADFLKLIHSFRLK